MSRLASKPISLPAGVSCKAEGIGIIKISKGSKIIPFSFDSNYVEVKIEDSSILFSYRNDVKVPAHLNGLLGTTWALFKSAIKDAESGFKAKINLVGVGYRATTVKAGSANYLRMVVGFSHPIFVFIPSNIAVKVDKDGIFVTGENNQSVMTFCSRVRSQKKPRVYDGTGVLVNDEVVIKKEGKKK